MLWRERTVIAATFCSNAGSVAWGGWLGVKSTTLFYQRAGLVFCIPGVVWIRIIKLVVKVIKKKICSEEVNMIQESSWS